MVWSRGRLNRKRLKVQTWCWSWSWNSQLLSFWIWSTGSCSWMALRSLLRSASTWTHTQRGSFRSWFYLWLMWRSNTANIFSQFEEITVASSSFNLLYFWTSNFWSAAFLWKWSRKWRSLMSGKMTSCKETKLTSTCEHPCYLWSHFF